MLLASLLENRRTEPTAKIGSGHAQLKKLRYQNGELLRSQLVEQTASLLVNESVRLGQLLHRHPSGSRVLQRLDLNDLALFVAQRLFSSLLGGRSPLLPLVSHLRHSSTEAFLQDFIRYLERNLIIRIETIRLGGAESAHRQHHLNRVLDLGAGGLLLRHCGALATAAARAILRCAGGRGFGWTLPLAGILCSGRLLVTPSCWGWGALGVGCRGGRGSSTVCSQLCRPS
mmetsp:Transcript_15664/g.36968  ORF Transcript_15664/g.36968 Transcript_15664/m.36968 type:complete len:229 (+) Transcript_15664:1931-2617(+)